MDSGIDIIHAMLDDDFQKILETDPVLIELESLKHDARTEFFELMMVLSRTFLIDGVVVQAITPAIWAYLYAIGSPYACNGDIDSIDTDVMLYILHNGIGKVDADLIQNASGFCEQHGIDPNTAEIDLKTMVYLSFRPLEMLQSHGESVERQRFGVDWLTHIVSVVAPLANRTSEQVMYDMSLCECMSYMIQQARQYDYRGEIRRRNSDEISAEIYQRTMELGKQYWEEHYGDGERSE